ncbi:MAG: tetratricopeptide repeat protein [Ignavibacteria bacterium]|jgi:tetratricopeptide (TPR) repeat protein|nr:tetratricopeptide repeat protein [Ignavibacteria bacterium]
MPTIVFCDDSPSIENAISALKNKDYNTAKSIYSALITKVSSNASFYYGRGMANYYLNNDNNAEKDFTQAIDLDNDMTEAYLGLALVLIQKNDYQRCLTILNKALKNNSDRNNFYYLRGFVNYLQEDFQNAASDFSQVIVNDRDNADALYGRAISYYRMKNYPDATADFKELLSFNNYSEALLLEVRRLLNVINNQ